MSSFCISGFGRSGTKWLAQLMGRSPTWAVAHEPNRQANLDALRFRFECGVSAGNYGEVNSLCLPCLFELPVERRGVILRCPRQLVVSCIRKGHPLYDDLLDNINTALCLIDVAVERGAVAIPFHRMVTDRAMTQQLLRAFGVTDVEVTDEDLAAKVNASDGVIFSKLANKNKSEITSRFDWFTRKYEDLLETAQS